MEKLQDKIIRDRLNSLDTLPGDYTPNLASKWSVLEAGLDNKKRRPALTWKYVAVAAMLLMIGGAALWLMRPVKPINSKTTEHKKTDIAPVTIKQTEPEKQVEVQKRMVRKVKRSVNETPEQAIVAVTVDTGDVIAQPEKQVAIAPVKVKKPRFTEIEFNENPIATETPSEPVMAAQKFRFKVNIGNSVSGTQSEEGQVRLRKTLN